MKKLQRDQPFTNESATVILEALAKRLRWKGNHRLKQAVRENVLPETGALMAIQGGILVDIADSLDGQGVSGDDKQ
ncbi:MAG: hypothetical protein ACE5HE_00240 [Phycisphaerae bacterium]